MFAKFVTLGLSRIDVSDGSRAVIPAASKSSQRVIEVDDALAIAEQVEV
jgi:hypothetical protein